MLPPRPQRQELEIESEKDIVHALNYYEHLVQEWEQWADTVEELIEE